MYATTCPDTKYIYSLSLVSLPLYLSQHAHSIKKDQYTNRMNENVSELVVNNDVNENRVEGIDVEIKG